MSAKVINLYDIIDVFLMKLVKTPIFSLVLL